MDDQTKGLEEETKFSSEASYWHLPETASHDLLQKVWNSGK
jgi:hypothetical protein